MNVEKLHSLLSVIKQDFDNQKIISKFSDFTWKMSQYVEDSSEANSTEFKSALDELNKSLEEFSCNNLVPSQNDILKHLNGQDLVGHGLRQAIENILSTNAAVQVDVSQQLTDLLAAVNQFYERIADIIRGLSHFKLEPENFKENEFELGFIFPGEQFNLTLAKLKNEIIFVNKFLSDIYETTGEQRPDADIRSLQSDDTALYLRTTVIIADKVMRLIKGIVAVYDTIGNIQKKTKELKSLDVSQNILDLLKEEEKQRITLGLESLKSDLFDRESNKNIDDGRMNELENSISIDLKQLAQKIEHGLKIEVSIPTKLLRDGAVLDGVDIMQLAELGRLMSNSTFTHDPVLLLSSEKIPPLLEPMTDTTAELESAPTPAKKKKSKTTKKKKSDSSEEFLIENDDDSTIDTDSENEFDWVITDD